MSNDLAATSKPPKIHGQCFGFEKRGDLVILWIEDDGLWYEQEFAFDKYWTRELIGLLKKVKSQ